MQKFFSLLYNILLNKKSPLGVYFFHKCEIGFFICYRGKKSFFPFLLGTKRSSKSCPTLHEVFGSSPGSLWGIFKRGKNSTLKFSCLYQATDTQFQYRRCKKWTFVFFSLFFLKLFIWWCDRWKEHFHPAAV